MNNIKKILIISAHYYPLKGGTPTHTENLCTELANSGYEVNLVTQDNVGDDLDEYDNSQNYKVYRLKCGRFFQRDLFFPILVGLRITGYIKKIQPDIINISTGNYVPIGIKLSKKQDIKIVYTVHNVPPEEYTFNICSNASLNNAVKKIYFRLIRSVAVFCMRYGRYDKIISGSERTRERLVKACADKSRITVVTYGTVIPETANTVKKDSCNILTVAGIIEHKGQIEIIKSVPEIIKNNPNAHFYLVGPVRSEEYLRRINEMVEELGVSQYVTLTGEVTQDDLVNYYRMSDIYLQPSYQEGFCLSLLDALAYGIPAIGTPVGAIPEMIGNNRGILISYPNKSEIISSVIKLANNVHLRQIFSKNAREYVESEFDWKKVAIDTVNVYEKTILDAEIQHH